MGSGELSCGGAREAQSRGLTGVRGVLEGLACRRRAPSEARASSDCRRAATSCAFACSSSLSISSAEIAEAAEAAEASACSYV